MAAGRTTRQTGLLWCVAVGAWSLLFAAPHFYWALGGRAGLGAKTAAADAALAQSWFFVYNLVTAVLAICGVAVALVLAGGWSTARFHRWLLVATAAAGVALLLRGVLGLTALGVDLLSATFDERTPTLLLAIEPYFVLGGVVYTGMAWKHRKNNTGS